jgi:transposase
MQRRLVTPAERHGRATSSEVAKLRQELREEKLAREAAERRCRELEAKVDQLTKRVEQLLKAQNQTQELLQKKIRKLEKDVADRDKTIAKQAKSLAWFRKKVYGSTTEKGGAGDDTEKSGKQRRTKSKKGVNPRGQQPGSDGHGRTDRSAVPVGDVIPLDDTCKCDHCGVLYKRLETTEESTLFEHVEGLYRDIYERSKYVSQCNCEGKKIVTAPPPPKLYPRTDIGNSLWVRLIVQKFLHGVPTNRTLKDLSLTGFDLAQGTVTGGFKIIGHLLEPLYEQIANRCRACDLWNADETSWRIFNGSSTKWWLWMIASQDAVAYILDESRSGDVPNEFFEGCSGTLMTDRFGSYKGLHDDIKKAWCWVHVRRDFLDIALGVPLLKGWAVQWLKRIAKLFVLNHERFKLWEARQRTGYVWQEATKKLKKHLTKMSNSWQKELKEIGQADEQKKVLNSLRRHWEGLTLFLNDPRIPLHNNRAERLLRNAVILRKNSYGSGAEWSGHLAAKVFSIMQTWLINGLDPQQMLRSYFDECSKTPGRAPPNVSAFLPWRMTTEQKLAVGLPKGYSRPG